LILSSWSKKYTQGVERRNVSSWTRNIPGGGALVVFETVLFEDLAFLLPSERWFSRINMGTSSGFYDGMIL
jgi:hypothetical protein